MKILKFLKLHTINSAITQQNWADVKWETFLFLPSLTHDMMWRFWKMGEALVENYGRSPNPTHNRDNKGVKCPTLTWVTKQTGE